MISGLGGLPDNDLKQVMEGLRDRVVSLTDARVLVTGATGFVGRWVVASLIQARHDLGLRGLVIDVLVRDRNLARSRLGDDLWDELEIIEGDITGGDWSLPEPVTHVVHGATPASRRSGSGDARGVLVTSVLGSQHLLRALGEHETRPRVLHLSSGAVYGPQPASLERIPENWGGGPTPFLQGSPYAEGKRGAEAILESAARDDLIEAVHARLFAFLGPGLPTDESFAIGNFVSDALHHRAIKLSGDGSTIRSYLDARDMATWLILLLANGQPSNAYNVGSPKGQPLKHWASLCSDLAGVGMTAGNSPVGERSIYVPDVDKSKYENFYTETRQPREAITSWLKWLILRNPTS